MVCFHVSGIKDYELLQGDDLADAVWKGRMVCTGNCIKGADGKMVWNMDALYAAPVDLHNARLVVLYGALHGVVWQADVKSAYLQAPLGGMLLGCGCHHFCLICCHLQLVT